MFIVFAIVMAVIQWISAICILTHGSTSDIIPMESVGDFKYHKLIPDLKQEIQMRQLHNQETHHLKSQCAPDITTTKLATTLVSQTTLDRLLIMQETCRRWSSPIVMAVYITPQELSNKWNSILKQYSEQCNHMILIPYVARDEDERSDAYPINVLRNMALDEVKTTHVFMIDADFIPSVDLDEGIEKSIRIVMEQDKLEEQREEEIKVEKNLLVAKKIYGMKQEGRQMRDSEDVNLMKFKGKYLHALVVPAYERKVKSLPCQDFEECLKLTKQNPEFMPRSMQSLSQCVNAKPTPKVQEGNMTATDVLNQSKCIVFHSDYYIDGHGDTKSEEWLNTMNEEQVRTIPCISDGYEPYIVIPWCPSEHINHDALQPQQAIEVVQVHWAPLSPYYDERFHGYGKNKIQQILQLQAKGYQFSVIPALGFLTHHPHPMSITKHRWKLSVDKGDNGLMPSMEILYTQFEAELKKEYEGKVKLKTNRCIKPKSYKHFIIAFFIVIGGILFLSRITRRGT
jgi:hypothetical protein